MLEEQEQDRKLKGKEFDALEPQLHTRLLQVQKQFRQSNIATIVVIAGVEGAGKSEVVNRLNSWFDARDLRTFSYWSETEDETRRPPFWRFWRDLPPRGSIALMLGSWYTKPIIQKVLGEIDEAAFDKELKLMTGFESILAEDGVHLIKLWFHLPEKQLEKKLGKLASSKKPRIPESPFMQTNLFWYPEFIHTSEQALKKTDNEQARWQIIDASDDQYRDIRAGQVILESMESRLADDASVLEAAQNKSKKKDNREEPASRQHNALDSLDLSKTAGKNYEKDLEKYQAKLNELTWQGYVQGKSLVVVFEGSDAAGKGGTIRRVTAGIDARLFKVISIAAPTDEEKARHYLWRFWRHVPLSGFVTIYDRSWYGRVLVERVEGLASEQDWKRSYSEINHYEDQLVNNGITLCKFWLQIDPEEQMSRFRAREETPWKQHKITEEDWRNRSKQNEYNDAVNEMVERTGTVYAPWHLVPANDKKYARLKVLKTLCAALEESLHVQERL